MVRCGPYISVEQRRSHGRCAVHYAQHEEQPSARAFAVKVYAIDRYDRDVDVPPIAQVVRLQQELARFAPDCWAPVLEIDEDNPEGLAFASYWYERRLTDFLSRPVQIRFDEIRRVVERILRALVVLHTASPPRPHGALHPDNVFIDGDDLLSSNILLTDPAEEQRLNTAVGPRADLTALGRMVFELVTHEEPPDNVLLAFTRHGQAFQQVKGDPQLMDRVKQLMGHPGTPPLANAGDALKAWGFTGESAEDKKRRDREAAERTAFEAAQAKAREQAARDELERRTREEAERKAREEQQRRRAEERAAQQAAEEKRREREEAERKAAAAREAREVEERARAAREAAEQQAALELAQREAEAQRAQAAAQRDAEAAAQRARDEAEVRRVSEAALEEARAREQSERARAESQKRIDGEWEALRTSVLALTPNSHPLAGWLQRNAAQEFTTARGRGGEPTDSIRDELVANARSRAEAAIHAARVLISARATLDKGLATPALEEDAHAMEVAWANLGVLQPNDLAPETRAAYESLTNAVERVRAAARASAGDCVKVLKRPEDRSIPPACAHAALGRLASSTNSHRASAWNTLPAKERKACVLAWSRRVPEAARAPWLEAVRALLPPDQTPEKQAEVLAPAPPPPLPRSRIKGVVIVSAAVLLLCVGGFVAWKLTTKEPQEQPISLADVWTNEVWTDATSKEPDFERALLGMPPVEAAKHDTAKDILKETARVLTDFHQYKEQVHLPTLDQFVKHVRTRVDLGKRWTNELGINLPNEVCGDWNYDVGILESMEQLKNAQEARSLDETGIHSLQNTVASTNFPPIARLAALKRLATARKSGASIALPGSFQQPSAPEGVKWNAEFTDAVTDAKRALEIERVMLATKYDVNGMEFRDWPPVDAAGLQAFKAAIQEQCETWDAPPYPEATVENARGGGLDGLIEWARVAWPIMRRDSTPSASDAAKVAAFEPSTKFGIAPGDAEALRRIAERVIPPDWKPPSAQQLASLHAPNLATIVGNENENALVRLEAMESLAEQVGKEPAIAANLTALQASNPPPLPELPWKNDFADRWTTAWNAVNTAKRKAEEPKTTLTERLRDTYPRAQSVVPSLVANYPAVTFQDADAALEQFRSGAISISPQPAETFDWKPTLEFALQAWAWWKAVNTPGADLVSLKGKLPIPDASIEPPPHVNDLLQAAGVPGFNKLTFVRNMIPTDAESAAKVPGALKVSTDAMTPTVRDNLLDTAWKALALEEQPRVSANILEPTTTFLDGCRYIDAWKSDMAFKSKIKGWEGKVATKIDEVWKSAAASGNVQAIEDVKDALDANWQELSHKAFSHYELVARVTHAADVTALQSLPLTGAAKEAVTPKLVRSITPNVKDASGVNFHPDDPNIVVVEWNRSRTPRKMHFKKVNWPAGSEPDDLDHYLAVCEAPMWMITDLTAAECGLLKDSPKGKGEEKVMEDVAALPGRTGVGQALGWSFVNKDDPAQGLNVRRSWFPDVFVLRQYTPSSESPLQYITPGLATTIAKAWGLEIPQATTWRQLWNTQVTPRIGNGRGQELENLLELEDVDKKNPTKEEQVRLDFKKNIIKSIEFSTGRYAEVKSQTPKYSDDWPIFASTNATATDFNFLLGNVAEFVRYEDDKFFALGGSAFVSFDVNSKDPIIFPNDDTKTIDAKMTLDVTKVYCDIGFRPEITAPRAQATTDDLATMKSKVLNALGDAPSFAPKD